jgi:hypothetical protein
MTLVTEHTPGLESRVGHQSLRVRSVCTRTQKSSKRPSICANEIVDGYGYNLRAKFPDGPIGYWIDWKHKDK